MPIMLMSLFEINMWRVKSVVVADKLKKIFWIVKANNLHYFITVLTCVTRISPTAQYRHMCKRIYKIVAASQVTCVSDNSAFCLTTWV